MIRRRIPPGAGTSRTFASGATGGGSSPANRERCRLAAPHRLETVVDSTALPFSGTWTFELQPISGGTLVRVTERGAISSPPLRALAPLFSPPDRTLRRYLADLRASFARE